MPDKILVTNFTLTAPLDLSVTTWRAERNYDLRVIGEHGNEITYTVPRKLALLLKLDIQRLLAAEPDGEQ
jgi:hypothetical protein